MSKAAAASLKEASQWQRTLEGSIGPNLPSTYDLIMIGQLSHLSTI